MNEINFETASVDLVIAVNDLEKRGKLINAINEAVQSTHTIESEREHLKDIAQEVKETLGIASTEFNNLVKVKLDSFKVKAQRDKLQDSLDIVDTIFNKGV